MLRYNLLKLIIIFSLSYSSLVQGQSRDIIRAKAPTHTNKKHYSKSTEHKVKALVKNITRKSDADEAKVAAIFNWITRHISYDHQLRYDVTLQKKIYTSKTNVINHVLKRKKALCGGFSFLFQAMCESAGVPAKTIHGFSKKYGHQASYAKVDHTWNSVKIDGRWQLLDISWAISYGSPNKPDMFWFQTSPKDFYLSHIPAR